MAPGPSPSVRFTGYIQTRETVRGGVELSASINRARFAAYGTVADNVTWRIQGRIPHRVRSAPGEFETP